jgi:glyoxylate/hydroxypyruvate reductase A
MNLLLAGQFDDAERAEWAAALRQALPDHRLCMARGDVSDDRIDAAIVANPSPGSLAGLPRLRLIQSLWAGVDRLLADASLPPDVPIARMVDPAMNRAMGETALWATLALHRGFFDYAAQQRAGRWAQQAQRRADEVPVLLLGLGQMGREVARRLSQQGYPVSAWRRGPAASSASAGMSELLPAGITVHTGAAALFQALRQAQVLINLLPLTDDTRGLLDARLLAALPRGAGLVNLARGAHVVDADLLAALASGQIGQAVLDVFHTEPLPAAHAFWQHPRVVVLPHAAALTDARSAAAAVARNIEALAAGRPLAHLVLRSAGY